VRSRATVGAPPHELITDRAILEAARLLRFADLGLSSDR
jgi:hypothetical protein